MFLALAYVLFLFQIVTILLLISPLPIRIRHYISELSNLITNNFYIKIIFFIGVAIMLGLFVENLMTVIRYDGIIHNFSDTILTNVYAGKHEIMLKLFRAQRNMYLTFIVNFNWVIIFGIQMLIRIIHCQRFSSELHKNEQ